MKKSRFTEEQQPAASLAALWPDTGHVPGRASHALRLWQKPPEFTDSIRPT